MNKTKLSQKTLAVVTAGLLFWSPAPLLAQRNIAAPIAVEGVNTLAVPTEMGLPAALDGGVDAVSLQGVALEAAVGLNAPSLGVSAVSPVSRTASGARGVAAGRTSVLGAGRTLRGLGAAVEDKKKISEMTFRSRYDGGSPASVHDVEAASKLGVALDAIAGFVTRREKPASDAPAALPSNNAERFATPVDKIRRFFAADEVKATKDVDLTGPGKILGQPIAIEAIRDGLRTPAKGFNIVVSGSKKSGRTFAAVSLAQEWAEEAEKTGAVKGYDLVSVHDFDDPEALKVMKLPEGDGRKFQLAMSVMINGFKQTAPMMINQAAELVVDSARSQISQIRFEGFPTFGVELVETQKGFMVGLTHEGQLLKKGLNEAIEKKLVSEEDGQKLAEQFNALVQPIVSEMQTTIAQAQEEAVGMLFTVLSKEILKGFPVEGMARYLTAARAFALRHMGELAGGEEAAPKRGGGLMAMLGGGGGGIPASQAFEVEVVAQKKGIKVTHEKFPSYENLIGSIYDGPDGKKHIKLGSALTSDVVIIDGWELVKKGDGGYQAIEALLKYGEAEVTDTPPGTRIMGRNRAPIVEKVKATPKVVLVLDPELMAMLSHYSQDFAELFQIRAKFRRTIDITPENVTDYVEILARIVSSGTKNLIQLTQKGVAKILEASVKLSGSQKKLSATFGEIESLVTETARIARERGAAEGDEEDVMAAVRKADRRESLYEQALQEYVLEDKILVQTEGMVVGQGNGLAVTGDMQRMLTAEGAVRSALGVDASVAKLTRKQMSAMLRAGQAAGSELGKRFGHAMRIQAVIGQGAPGIHWIDEHMIGPIATKAEHEIEGFMIGRYGSLPQHITLSFEQMYDGLEGDSASLMKTTVITSAITKLPMRNDLAMTGSMDLKGRAQIIGGENEKITGFWKLCKARGLTGTQGIVMPETNLDGLQLPEELVQDVKDGKFHIYMVRTIDEAMEIFFNVKAGLPDKDGKFKPGTVNGIMQREVAKAKKG